MTFPERKFKINDSEGNSHIVKVRIHPEEEPDYGLYNLPVYPGCEAHVDEIVSKIPDSMTREEVFRKCNKKIS